MAANHPAPAELFARESGDGPTVLLLHGLGGDHSIWAEVIERLSPDLHVIAPDLRGHGRSPMPPNSTFSIEEMESDLVRLIIERTERAPHPVHVVGLSAGAFLALRLAREHPGRVKSLVLVNGAAYCDPHTKEIIQSWQTAFREGGDEGLMLRLIKDLYDRDWAEAHFEIVDRMHRQFTEPKVGVVVRWADQLTRFDMRGQLARLRVPTLILQGMSDVVIDPSHGRFLRQSIPGSELRLYRDTGHMMPIEKPQETADAIREQVGKAEKASPPPPSA